MKKLLFGIVIAAFSILTATAQSPTPPPDNDVVKISTNLIQIDVSVTDSKGKVVRDLRPGEFEIYENGKKQKITGVTFVSSRPPQPEQRPAPAGTIAVPLPPSQLKLEAVRRTIALLVDDLTLSAESIHHTRRALKKFVDEQMEEGDLIAIVRTGAGIGALQQFTSDKRLLYAAIEKVRWNPLGSGGLSPFAPLEAKIDTGAPEDPPEPGERTQEGIEREFNDFRESYFATGTLGGLNYVIRGMADLPGRKSAILFSDGFRMTNADALGFLTDSRSIGPMRKLIEAANRASVVIYAMDPRGLAITGITAADNTGGRTQQEIAQVSADRTEQLLDTQDSLKYISEETGGFALINNNDLPAGVRRVLEDQSYYLVGYEPEDETFDAVKRAYNKLEVKVLRPGVTARHRKGFIGVPDRAVLDPTPTGLAAALTSPFIVNGIDLRLNALFAADEKKSSFVRSLLHIDADDITFADAPNGQKKATFEVFAVSFGDNGAMVDQLSKGYTITVKADLVPTIKAEGLIYQFVFPVKKAGPYQYRVAIRDIVTGRIGTASQFIDIPDLKKNRLTVSSLFLENVSREAWQKSNNGDNVLDTNPAGDTAQRRIKLGSVLRYGFLVYNARSVGGAAPKLTARTRIFREGKLVMDGASMPVDLLGQTSFQRIGVSRALSMGAKMVPGDYVMQVIVTDEADPKKPRIATQVVQFELVN